MDIRANASVRAALLVGAILAVATALVAALTVAGPVAGARPASAGPQQAAYDPNNAPLPHYTAAEDSFNQALALTLHFASRRQVTVDPPELRPGKAHIQLTAPPQLQLELFDRSGGRLRTVLAWHPLRREHASVPRPTDPGPRLGAPDAAAPQQPDPHAYDPYQVIGEIGVGELYLPFDPRVSSIRIVDLTLGGVELAKVSVEGAARRYCAQQPTSSFCQAGKPGGVGGPSRSTLYLDPYTMTVGSSQVFTVSLKARRMVDLFAGQVALTFDPQVLQVVDQDPGRPGAQIVPADFPKPDTVLRNAANNSTGRLEYFFTLTGEKPGVSGQGTLAHLVLRGVGPGKTLLAITDTVLSDPQSLAIPTKTENALITVLDGPTANLSGQVELERRPTSAGARVCSSGRCVTTAADGRFTLTGIPTGRMVEVTHPSYLRAARLLPAGATGNVTWPKVRLLAGDLDKDDRVDIVDAVMIGQRFNLRFNAGGANPRWLEATDITDDDVVNILDMTGVQFNFLKTAPGPWPTLLAQLRRADATGAAATARVSLTPADARADAPGQDIRLELRVDDVVGLYGYRVKVRYDPAKVQIQDVSPGDEGVQVAISEFLDPINSFVLLNRADNATGVLDLSVTQTDPAEGVDGGGVLATITFRGRVSGASDVTLEEAVLVDDSFPTPAIIPSERAGATITIGSEAPRIYLPFTTIRR